MKNKIAIILFLAAYGTLAAYAQFVYEAGSKIQEIPKQKNEDCVTSLALYQKYYAFQSQRDDATKAYRKAWKAAFWDEQRAMKQLEDDSSDIESHRLLVHAQNKQKQLGDTWYITIKSLDDTMNNIRQELKNRGEPPPRNPNAKNR